jgi:hypothetical protein
MSIAIFSTWTTYGTWLPGDRRTWFEPGTGHRLADRAPAIVSPIEYESSLLD